MHNYLCVNTKVTNSIRPSSRLILLFKSGLTNHQNNSFNVQKQSSCVSGKIIKIYLIHSYVFLRILELERETFNTSYF